MKVLGYGSCRGIDLTYWRRSEELGVKKQFVLENTFTFLFVGRIVGDKGINELVDAFVKLQNNENRTRLILVGQYEKELDPISELTQMRIATTPGIEAVGPQYGDNLKAYYAASDCFVFPSYREGFPNTPIEAGAMGLPCIVTDINGSREIIKNHKNGVIIPSKDADALYEAMLRMMEDDQEREQMAANARPMIEARFEQGFVRKCLYDFYEEIM